MGAACLALALTALGCSAPPEPNEPPRRLVVLHFNDWHGHLEPFERRGVAGELGGAARLARLISERREAAAEAGADSVLLFAGDVLQGTPMSTVFRGEPDFALLARMELDASCIGNHDFDFGVDLLEERMGAAPFPVLAANVARADGSAFAPGSIVLTTPRHGMRVAVLGLVTDETPILTAGRNVDQLRFSDPVEVARRELPALAESAHLVLVLSHCGAEVDGELAGLPGVSAVIGAHDQVLIDPPGQVGEVPFFQAKEWGEYLGEATFAVSPGRGAEYEGHRYLQVTEALEGDPEVESFVAGYRMRLGEELDQVVANAAVRLLGEREEVRRGETNLGNLIADVTRQVTGADVALINSGAIRASIDAGPITLEEVMLTLPYDNELVILELSGEELRQLIEHGLSMPSDSGGFFQLSGLRLRVSGDSVVEASQADGQRLDPARRYRVAMSDFTAGGGDGYDELVGRPAERTGFLLNGVFLDWLRREESIEAGTDGRLEIHSAGESRSAA